MLHLHSEVKISYMGMDSTYTLHHAGWMCDSPTLLRLRRKHSHGRKILNQALMFNVPFHDETNAGRQARVAGRLHRLSKHRGQGKWG